MTITITHLSLFEYFSTYRLQHPQLQNERCLRRRCYRLDQFLSDYFKSCLIGFGKDETAQLSLHEDNGCIQKDLHIHLERAETVRLEFTLCL